MALCAASAIVLGAAFMLWEARSQAAQGDGDEHSGQSSTRIASHKPQSGWHPTQAASQLLHRSFVADNASSYSADVTATAMYGVSKMQTRAHLMRAPRRLSITYLSGDRRGLMAGYNERWFWRREEKTAPMQAYASVALRPAEMAAQRFALLERNYDGAVVRRERIDGRNCDVVEVRRKQALENTQGPFQRLWLDKSTGLTMRTDAYNCWGNLVMRSALSNLQIAPPISSQTFVPPEQMKSIARKSSWKNEELGSDYAQVKAKTGIEPPQPSWLPTGFAFDSVGMHHASLAKGSPLTALSRYGDGLSVITIFAFKTKPSSAAPSKSEPNAKSALNAKSAPKVDATSKASQPVSCTFGASAMAMCETSNGLTLLVVGDLPTPMLVRILNSVSAR